MRDVSAWLSGAERTGSSLSVGGSSFREIVVANAVDCMVSLSNETERPGAPPWSTDLSGSAVVGLCVWGTAFEGEAAFGDTEIIKKSVVGSVGCPSRASVSLKTTSSSICRMLSQTHE
jgi:hypothetical protein